MSARDPLAELMIASFREHVRPNDLERARGERRLAAPRIAITWIVALAVAAAILVAFAVSRLLPDAALRIDRPRADEAIDTRETDARPEPVRAEIEPATLPRVGSGAIEVIAAPPEVPAASATPTTLAARKPAASTDPEPTAPAVDVRAEMLALERAHRVLADGDPTRALALLDQSARDFPRGVLTLERRALRIVALCANDKRVQGRGEANVLLREHPDAPYADRIAKACAEPQP